MSIDEASTLAARVEELEQRNAALTRSLANAEAVIAQLVEKFRRGGRSHEVEEALAAGRGESSDGAALFEVHIVDATGAVVGCSYCDAADTTETLMTAITRLHGASSTDGGPRWFIQVEETGAILPVDSDLQLVRDGGFDRLKKPVRVLFAEASAMNAALERTLWITTTSASARNGRAVTDPSLLFTVVDVLHHIATFLQPREFLRLAATSTTMRMELLQRQSEDVPWQFMDRTFSLVPRSAHVVENAATSPLTTAIVTLDRALYVPGPFRLEQHLRLLFANRIARETLQPFLVHAAELAIRDGTELPPLPVTTRLEPGGFAVGQAIDVLDTVNRWYDCVIIGVDNDARKVTVHFNEWGTKWDEEIAMDSPRLAPYGSRSAYDMPPIRHFMNSEVRFCVLDPSCLATSDRTKKTITQAVAKTFAHLVPDPAVARLDIINVHRSSAVLSAATLVESRHALPTAVRRYFTPPRELLPDDPVLAVEGEGESPWASDVYVVEFGCNVQAPLRPISCASAEQDLAAFAESRPRGLKFMRRRIPLDIVRAWPRRDDVRGTELFGGAPAPRDGFATVAAAPVAVIRGHCFVRLRDGVTLIQIRYGAISEHYNR